MAKMGKETRIALEIMRECGKESNLASRFLDGILSKVRPDELVMVLEKNRVDVKVTLSQLPAVVRAMNRVLEKYGIGKEEPVGLEKDAVQVVDDILEKQDVAEKVKEKLDEARDESPKAEVKFPDTGE